MVGITYQKGGVMARFKRRSAKAQLSRTSSTSETSGFFRPFENLKTLLENKSFQIAPSPVKPVFSTPLKIDLEPDHPEYDQKLFRKAMSDVTPLSRGKHIYDKEDRPYNSEPPTNDKPEPVTEDITEHESLLRLRELVENGNGFVVSQTPEYIEGAGYCDNPEMTDRLHRGEFSIQAVMDLHGMGVETAQDVFDQFIREAVLTGKRAVMIIHGRGLSSPQKPVLKTKVQDWLTRGPWRKWIIAFSSARSCDGGAGATYILLRRWPFTKSLRKKLMKRKLDA